MDVELEAVYQAAIQEDNIVGFSARAGYIKGLWEGVNVAIALCITTPITEENKDSWFDKNMRPALDKLIAANGILKGENKNG